MPAYRIPFNKPSIVGKEYVYIADAVAQGHSSGDGFYTKRCHSFFEQAMAVPRALLTTSCTHALEMAALLLNIQPGDEVIVPSFSFVSTVTAFVLRGASPVFIDIRPDTMNLDETRLEAVITPRTRAIVVVHYGGVACEMSEIIDIASQHGVPVVEDNAHGLFARYKGKTLGTFGCLATQSFHETKNVTCGEGGALIVNDTQYLDRAEILREKGTNRSRFFRGEVDKYSWVDLGSSYLPSDILAAFLYAQLEQFEHIHHARQRIWNYYRKHLAGWARSNGIDCPYVPAHCQQSYHMFYLVLPSLSDRQSLIEHLKRRGILSVFHYQPLHVSEMGRRFGGYQGQCPMAERAGDRLVRLPFYNDLTRDDQDEVIEAIKQWSSCRPATSPAVGSKIPYAIVGDADGQGAQQLAAGATAVNR